MSSPAPREKESKRPSNSKFKQQNLPAWKPILTPKTVIPTFFVVGIIFISVGIPLFLASDGVTEVEFDYTRCTNELGEQCADLDNARTLNNTAADRCTCRLNVTLSGFSGDETFLYYGLENYYQNHRRYVKSRSDPQLRSSETRGGEDCDPLTTAEDGRFFAPCGLIANSLFNDTIQIFQCAGAVCTTPVGLSGIGISWRSDRETKFRNPPSPNNNVCAAEAFLDANSIKPPNWPVKACELGAATAAYNPWSPQFGSSGLGYENEDLINWMRTAALPTFRKLYRKIAGGLSDGDYQIVIQYNYPVTVFDGKKRVILSTTSWLGGDNPFLGIIYLVVGCLSVMTGVFFAFFQSSRGRELGDAKYLRWDRE